MRKVLIALVALFAVTLVSCKHEIKQEKVNFTINEQADLIYKGNKSATIEEKGFKQEELYTMVKNNVMKYYEHPDMVLNENKPTSLVINGYSEDVFNYEQYKTMSMTYRILFEFSDGEIKVTPTINELTNEEEPEPFSFATFIKWNIIEGNETGKFPSNFLPSKKKIEDRMNEIINYLLWGDGTQKKE